MVISIYVHDTCNKEYMDTKVKNDMDNYSTVYSVVYLTVDNRCFYGELVVMSFLFVQDCVCAYVSGCVCERKRDWAWECGFVYVCMCVSVWGCG